MRMLNQWVLVVACGVSLFVASGCGSSKPARYYVLSSMDRPVAKAAGDGAGRTIGVGPVRLPSYLDRQQIVSRTSDNSVKLAQFDRWAEPLKDSVPRIITANLAALLPNDRVVLYPWHDVPECKVSIDLQRFDGIVGGDAELDAEWSLSCGAKARTELRTPTRIVLPVDGANYDALARTQSLLLRALSEAIAKDIEANASQASDNS